MQLTMKKMGAAAMAGALALGLAAAVSVAAPGTAHAAGKVNIAEDADISIETEKYNQKTGIYKDLAAYKNGKQVKPKVTVTYYKQGYTDENGNYVSGETITLKKGKDYTIAYKSNKNVGRAYVVVKGKGQYKGTAVQSFDVNPKATKITKVKAAKKALTVTWKKLSAKQADGYKVSAYTRAKHTYTDDAGNKKTSYSYHFEGSKIVKGANVNTATVKGLKAKTKYYVTVSPYKFVTGSYKSMASKYDSDNKFVGRKIVNNSYATTLWGQSADYKAKKTK